jgi:hypothetical protein
MDNPRNDALLGLFLSVCFAFVLFVMIPQGVDIPTEYDPGQLPPSAYPTWIAIAALILSLLLTGVSLCRMRGTTTPESTANVPLKSVFRVGLGFALLLLFWIFIHEIGMLLGSFLLYALYAVLSGERNWTRLLLVDACLCGLLYFFFVKLAALPVPLGPFQSLVL